MKSMIEFSDVSIGFGQSADVLRNFDLEVREGEFVSLLGPSGCGKSTTLNVLAGLLQPRRGAVTFDGSPIRGVNTAAGYVTQDDTLLPWLTIAKNVGLPLKLRKVGRREIEDRVESLLALTGLESAGPLFPSQLSGGMKRRALLARALIYRPALLMVDEPFAALDAQLRTELHAELLRIVRAENTTTLFVTHDIFEAGILSDRVVVVGDRPGRVVADIPVPFGAVRDVHTLRFEPEFNVLERTLHSALASARKVDA